MRASFLLMIGVCGLLCPRLAAAAPKHDYVEGEVLTTFREPISTEAAHTVLARHALRLDEHYDRVSRERRRVTGLVRAHGWTTERLMAELQADPNVASVEPNFLRQVSAAVPDDTNFALLWGLHNTGQTVNGTSGTSGVDTGFLAAWKLARPDSAEVVVCVVDTGMDTTHPDLAANLWTNPGEIAGNGIDDDHNSYIDDVHGYDFTAGTAMLTDTGGHGTHVAGTIAAVGRNGAGVIGLDYRAKVLPLKVSSDGINLTTSAVLAAYNYALALRQRGVNLVAINASFGGASASTTEQAAITALRDAGVVVCAAAGNEGVNNDTTPKYPASYTLTNIIAVAAHSQGSALPYFSNYGATSVDLAAPGVNIYSAMPASTVPLTTQVTVGTTVYQAAELVYSGATPVAGLTKQVHSCGIGNSGEFPAGVSGNIALIQRGTITFATKVGNAMSAGAVAAIICDNTADPLGAGSWSLGASGNWIPTVQITKASGEAILARLVTTGTVVNARNTALAYKFMEGTSMATPHVTAAVAFAAMNFPNETPAQRVNRILTHTTPVAAFAGMMTSGGRLNLLGIVDTDGDGLPDWWETDSFGSLAQGPNTDFDADSSSNLEEFVAATNPASASSQPAFSTTATVVDSAGKHFRMAFPTTIDRLYQIEWSDSLQSGSWTALGSAASGTGSTVEVTDPTPMDAARHRFYRLRIAFE